jgi:hypothetical protein
MAKIAQNVAAEKLAEKTMLPVTVAHPSTTTTGWVASLQR